jgi:mannose-6-phosphate isomerase-like protein (cupin superfamily)
MTVKATGASSGEAYTLMEQVAPPGFSPPRHIHHVEDEAFYVLRGRVRFQCGDRESTLCSGDYVFLPKGVPHTFRVEGTEPAKMLQWTTPSGLEEFVREVGLPTSVRELPPDEPFSADLPARLRALGPKYRFSIVGPPLDA